MATTTTQIGWTVTELGPQYPGMYDDGYYVRIDLTGASEAAPMFRTREEAERFVAEETARRPFVPSSEEAATFIRERGLPRFRIEVVDMDDDQ